MSNSPATSLQRPATPPVGRRQPSAIAASLLVLLAVAPAAVRSEAATSEAATSESGTAQNAGSEGVRIERPGAAEFEAAASGPDPAFGPVLDAIERLESGRDAKCHSTASRFEDFIYGTPLNEAGRSAKVELQKQLARQIWSGAARSSDEAGVSGATAHFVQREIDALLTWEAVSKAETLVRFSTGSELRVSNRRLEQYASIAYSLRAILAVQQDLMISGDGLLPPLDDESIDRMRSAIDLVTLCSLLRADQAAREKNEFELGPAPLQSAWNSFVRPTEAWTPATGSATAPGEARARGLAVLDELIANKAAAYRAYNELDERSAHELFIGNTVRFYARTPVVRSHTARRDLIAAIESEMNGFAVSLLADADRRAAEAGHDLIRSEDANGAVQHALPHQIDEFEDVHVFPKLGAQGGVTLEAYDCDSYRDFGIHWGAIKHALHRQPEGGRLLDPFAAEIIAEAISQFGVLVLRIAGDIRRRDAQDVHLQVADLALGTARIARLAERHRAAPALPTTRGQIVSSDGDAGTAPASGLFFEEVTAASGVDFAHRSSKWLGEFRLKQIQTPPTFSGGGVAAEDIDGDGDSDLLFVGGIGNALFLNDGSGHFERAPESLGLAPRRPDGSFGEARNPIIVDFDNDGHQDILITYVDDEHRLYRGLGDARFEDVSAGSGLGGKGLVGGPATVFDFDRDGLLDLYIGHFGDYLTGAVPTFDRDNRGALPNRLFRNRGGLRFEDVSAVSGTDDTGWAQAVSHVDFDRDGLPDLVVANDYGRNAMLRNRGDGTFENVAPTLGMTKPYHSMNVGVADVNRDGFPDIYISNLATLVKDNKYVFPDVNTPLDLNLRALSGMLVKESDVLYMSQVEGEGDDDGERLARYEPSSDIERGATSTGWAWDAEFFDFDHDGDDDLYLVNGTNDYNALSMIYSYGRGESAPDGEPAEEDKKDDKEKAAQVLLSHSRESNVFFVNEGGRLRNASSESGVDFVGNSRSTAYFDLEGDGDLDIAVNNFHSKAKVFRSRSEQRGLGWLKIQLVGDPERGSNRDAVGARIVLRAKGLSPQTREIRAGSGYLSMNPKEQHFGLGRAETAEALVVWPNGDTQELRGLTPNRRYLVKQGVEQGVPPAALETGG